MPISDLFTHPQLVFRIVEKKQHGSEFVFASDTGFQPQSRFGLQTDKQSDKLGAQTEIARFTFPTNREGKMFFYNDYQHTINLRTNVTDGISGTISELYGRGIDEISMRGVFPLAGKRTVILPTEFVPSAFLRTFEPKDWVQSFKEFIQYFADLNDPYSRLWNDKTYTLDKSGFSFDGLSSRFSERQQNDFGYEFQVIDEYAEQIYSVMPRNPRIYGNASQPLSFAWSIDFTVVEDKMQAPYQQIPDDTLDLAASFRMLTIDEIPVIGALSTIMSKLINVTNSVTRAMAVIASYDMRSKITSDVAKLNSSSSQLMAQMSRINTSLD